MATSKNVVYDSMNDTSNGRKRAVELTGGVSVAERARLFGTQIALSSAAKNSKSQRPPINNQPTKPKVVPSEKKHQPFKTDINRYSKQDISHSSPQRIPNNYRPPPVQLNDKPKREYSPLKDKPKREYSPVKEKPKREYSPLKDSRNYSTVIKTPHQVNYTEPIPGESYTSDDDPYFKSYDRPPKLQNTNYFQPIQDPLEVLYRNSSQTYAQQQIPIAINNNNTSDSMQPFDLGNLINRIQQDYLNNVRPYVSSVQFVENEQSLTNLGFLTSTTTRKDYSKRSGGSAYHYDIIDTNEFYPRYTKPYYNQNNYSSMKRRKHRRRYHDQASSPIYTVQPSTPTNRAEPSPPTPIQKPPTPVVESSSEEEETTAANTQAEESKTTEVETSSEDEASEVPVPITKIETPITQRTEFPRPIVPTSTPSTVARTPAAKPSETETSESEDSDSDSDSDSDDDDKKTKPSPALRSNNPRTTPQITIRGTPERPNTDNKNTDQPPEPSNSGNSFDLQSSKKSSTIGNKFKSITNKFRRNKTS